MKKFLVFLLSLTICLTPSLTFASAAEKWQIIENVYDKSKNTVKVEARKIVQTAANSARYKVEVPVNASTLGSSVKGMLWAGVAVSAVTALIEGVGWIIDTGSKVIKKPKDQSLSTNSKYYYQVVEFGTGNLKYYYDNQTASDAICKSGALNSGWIFVSSAPYGFAPDQEGLKSASCTIKRSEKSPDELFLWSYQRIKNPSYDPNSQPEFIPVSDSELGNEILGKGTEPNSKTEPNEEIITSAYGPNSGTDAGAQTDTALDNAPPQPDTEPNGGTKPKPNVDTDGDGVPDTHDPTKPSVGEQFELPNFCSWAVTVCEWYTQYKTDSKNVETHRVKELSFWEKVQDYMNWSREPPEKDDSDNDVAVKTPEAFDNSVFSKDRFAVSRQCPIPEQHTISLSGVSVNFSFDMTPLCQVLILARPALVACSYLYAAYIVIGAARNG